LAEKKVYVTKAHKDAARTIVRRSASTGTFVSRNVEKIANAKSSRTPEKT
jgi:hypothetical protein